VYLIYQKMGTEVVLKNIVGVHEHWL